MSSSSISVEAVRVAAGSRSPEAAHHTANPVAVYQRAQVMGASPMQLILIVYDLALAACGRRDAQRASRAITELVGTLDFDYDEIAVPLFHLYEYCLRVIRSGSFDEASKIMRQLKDAWEIALRQGHARGNTHGDL